MPPLLEMAISHRAGDFALDVELVAPRGPLVIIGPSGAGKTLTLRAIAGIVRPRAGRIALNGRLLFDSEAGVSLPAQARRVGYVPQEYALFPHLSVEGNISFGLRGTAGEEKRGRVEDLLTLTGLGPQRALKPRQLSGGQRQRVALARALAVDPDVLLLDEPFAALDVPTRQTLMDDLQRLLTEARTAAIIVTHDRNEALRLAEYMAVLIEGRIRQTGTLTGVFASPADEEVAAFVGVETIAAGHVQSLDNGVPVTEVAGHLIEGGSGFSPGDQVLVCLRPEDVTIALAATTSSARNHLSARVSRIAPAGPYVRVELDAGFTLVALVTRRALEELLLAPGAEVVATFKASAVHLIRK
jgi:molybdenum ABC transporter ATP-binding protein